MEDIRSNIDKIQRIKSIIEREIEKELVSKQNEVSDITEKIKIVLRNLDILKYIAAVNYYDTNTTLTQKKGQDDENEEEKGQTQTQIHPCIKKLLPFKSNYNQSFGDYLSTHAYETRNSKKLCESATVTIKKEVDSDANQEKCVSSSDKVKVPQYIPPLPSSDRKVSTPSRGHVFKENYRIVVGNVSKWIPPDMREDNSTHKWMVYVRDKESNKDVTKLLRKVRYFLHESYQPHDIIDVTSAPFHLTRRGWGEFPIRVQLHFIHPLNKPVDIIHNLKLDMTCSGIQMLGAETVVDVSLYQSNSLTSEKAGNSKTNSNSKCEVATDGNAKEKQDVYDGSLLTSINGIKPVNCYPNVKMSEDVDLEMKIKQEPEDEFENETVSNDGMAEINLALNNNKKFLLDRRKIMRIIEIEHDYLRKGESDLEKPLAAAFANSFLKSDGVRNSNERERAFKNGAVLDAVHLSQMMKRKRERGFGGMELWRNKSEEEIFRNLVSTARRMETETQSRCSTKAFRHLYMVNILQRAHSSNLKTVESLLRWFVQRWPIVTKLSSDPVYKNLHPYSCPFEEEFFNYNIGKQRSAEWFRAKAIQKVLTSLKPVIPIEEEIWSTKQILLWSRFHGYSPAVPFRRTTDKGSEEERESQSKRLKLNESSSDSDDGVSDNSNKRSRGMEDKYVNGLSLGGKKKNYKKSRRKEVSERTIERHKDYRGMNTYTPADDGERFGANEFRVLESRDSEEEIEVVELETKSAQGESPNKKREPKLEVTTIPSEEVLVNKFVTEAARQIGIKVIEEEVIPGVVCDSVSRVLTQSAFSFMDELLRRSLAQAWMRCGERCPQSLEPNDILATLMEYPKFDIFTNRGLGTLESVKSEL